MSNLVLSLGTSVLFLIITLHSTSTLAQKQLKIEYVYKPSSCSQKSKSGQTLSMVYRGTLENGKVFDSSMNRKKPFKFPVGIGKVIKGWDQGLLNMCVGEKSRLIIPHELAYGVEGVSGLVPPRATLIFEVELVGIGK